MHERGKAKLIRHHSKRLRQLGADEELIRQMVAKLNATTPVCSPAEEKQTESCGTISRCEDVPGESLPGRLGIPSSSNAETTIFGFQGASGHNSIESATFIKNDQTY